MTNFQIGFPDITFNATSIRNQSSLDTGCSINELVTGSRGTRFGLAQSSSMCLFLEFLLPSTAQQAANFVGMTRADLFQKDGGTGFSILAGQSSIFSPGFSGSTILANATFASQSLTGPRSEDYIATWSTSSTYWYWVVELSGTASKFPFNKIYLGTLFDIGREPVYGTVSTRRTKWAGSRDTYYVLDVEWQGITDAKREEFEEKIADYGEYSPVLLYDPSSLILNGNTSLHAWLTEWHFTKEAIDTNTLNATFEELI